MKIKVERKTTFDGSVFYKVWLGNHFQELSSKELIDLFTEITNAVPTASNNGFKATKAP